MFYKAEDGRILTPYAIVTTWGPEDYAWAKEQGAKFDEREEVRSGYYAAEGEECHRLSMPQAERDQYTNVWEYQDDILFKPVTPPPGYEIFATPQEAFTYFVACGHKLTVTGALQHADRYVFTEIRDRRSSMPEMEKSISVLREYTDFHSLEKIVKAGTRKTIATANELLDEAEAFFTGDDNESKYNRRSVSETRKKVAKAVEFLDAMDRLRETIAASANGDYFDLMIERLTGNETISVPRAPFERWALGWRKNPEGNEVALPWTRVAPVGLKCINDDVYHSDWMIGAGLNPRCWGVDRELMRAADDAATNLQAEKLKFTVRVLAGTGEVYGTAYEIKPNQGFPPNCKIGLISHAGPEFVRAAQEAIEKGYALITEEGGQVAHLVTVFRDTPLRLVRVPNARKIYDFGPYLTVDCDKGTVKTSVF